MPQVQDLRAHALSGRLAHQERQFALRVAGLQDALKSSQVQVQLLLYLTDSLSSENDTLRNNDAVARGQVRKVLLWKPRGRR